jgi:hypothetical protein
MARVIYLIFIRQFLVTAAVILVILVAVHFILGDSSPGIMGLIKRGMRFTIPVFFALGYGIPCLLAIREMLRTRAFAKRNGLSLSEYYALSSEEKKELLDRAQ